MDDLWRSKLPGQVYQGVDVDDLVSELGNRIFKFADLRVEESGVFHMALSGGTTPVVLFNHLANTHLNEFPWDSTHIWQVDERVVPTSDPRSNWKMINENLVSLLPIAADQLHPMPALAKNGDREYESSLREMAAVPLDIVLLGLGADGHTASLFPCTPALNEEKRWIVFNDGESVAKPRPRLTMTYPVLNSARFPVVLVIGPEKLNILTEITASDAPQERFPVLGLNSPHLNWFIHV